ncbi:MAG: hypothetical protein AAFZ02_08000, partial [Pseudomonadota bacterium]
RRSRATLWQPSDRGLGRAGSRGVSPSAAAAAVRARGAVAGVGRAPARDRAGHARGALRADGLHPDPATMAADGFHPGPAIYAAWAARAAEVLTPPR